MLSPSSQHHSPLSPSYVKTLEEIRLERIQRQSAAYYNMDGHSYPSRRVRVVSDDFLYGENQNKQQNTDFKVLTLDEIRKNRLKRSATATDSNSSDDRVCKGADKHVGDLYSDAGNGIKRYREMRNERLKSLVLPDSTSETQITCDEYDPQSYHMDLKRRVDVADLNRNNESDSQLRSSNDLYVKNNDKRSVDDTLSHPKRKPIKLRRFTKRTVDDCSSNDVNISQCRSKRIRLNNGKDMCSSSVSLENDHAVKNDTGNNNTSLNEVKDLDDNMELFLTSSPIEQEDQGSDVDMVDIIKDIDDLLND